MSRQNWPMLFCLLATLFSDPDTIGPSYSYKLIFMLVIAMSDNKRYSEIDKIDKITSVIIANNR